MSIRSRFRRQLALVAVALLAACQTSETGGPPVAANPPDLQPAGKLSAPVEISYQFMGEPRLGQPLEIQIDARPLQPDQTVILEVNAGAGLSLTSQISLPIRLPRVDEGRRDRVIVTPLAAGRSFLNVIATVTINGQPMQKVIAIPIQTGPVAGSGTDQPTDAEGTPIRSMPARETVE